MFYFLVILGSGLILLGLMLRRREVQIHENGSELHASLNEVYAARGMDEENTELAQDLSDRMEELEKTLFEQLLKWQVEKEELIQKLEVQSSEMPAENQVSERSAEIPVTEEMEKKKPYIEPEITEAVKEKTAEQLTAGREEVLKPEEIMNREENMPEKKPVPDNIRAIMDYEEQGLSVQEIAKVTRMKKGEVLLLRNLSKHYKK